MDAQGGRPPEELLDILGAFDVERFVRPVGLVRVVEEHFPPERFGAQGRSCPNSPEPQDAECGVLEPRDQWAVNVCPWSRAGTSLALVVQQDAAAQREGEGEGVVGYLGRAVVFISSEHQKGAEQEQYVPGTLHTVTPRAARATRSRRS